MSSGVSETTAQLAPASYQSPQQAQANLVGSESALDIALVPQYIEVAQGATTSLPLTARVLSNGVPQVGATVDYILVKGAPFASLSATTLVTDANGYASSTLQIAGMAGDVQVAVCVGPQNTPCLSFYGTSVPLGVMQLQPVAGTTQLLQVGQAFGPVTVRATDQSYPPNPVIAAPIAFQTVVARTNSNSPIITIGELNVTEPQPPVILSSSTQTIFSDANGLATCQINTGVEGATVVLGTASVGSASVGYQLQSLWPIGP
jgi:hypothetical protein